jgi:predicted ATPase/DNA-binding SARP family transcriptional activator
MVLSVTLLGPIQGARDAIDLPLGGPLQRGALALLALSAPDPITPEALVAGLWGDDAPPTARETLRAYLSRLRASLGAEHIVRSSAGYRLVVDRIDAVRFAELARAGRAALDRGDVASARAGLEDALALWSGEALADVRHLPFALAPAARLDEARTDVLEDLFDARLRAGGHLEVRSELQEVVDAAPLRERAAGLLMLALYRSGQQADALGVYARLRARLVEDLGIEPGPDTRLLHQRILSQDVMLTRSTGAAAPRPPDVPLAVAAGNVPTPLTSFIGRAAELGEARALLDSSRLVTLTGPGGSGKTRLALELIRSLPADTVDGPWFVELAGLQEGHLVASAVASAIGVAATSEEDPTDILTNALAGRSVVLVLDNCEHVVDDVARLTQRLLQRCPGARVLATSREPLGVPGERTFVVPPLPVDRDGGPADAVHLFAERAAQVQPGFTLEEGNLRVVRRICAELDGIPLAIELAAARLQLLSLEHIAQMLDDRFALLTSGSRTALPRHRTLMAAVAWSYDLLDDEERRLFAATSVFRDGFTLEALEALSPGPSTLDTLGRLVAKSMVTVDRSAGAEVARRYMLLETLREFAARQLTEPQRRSLADAHAEWCAALGEEAERHLRTASGRQWWTRLRVEQHNLRAAIRHALDSGQHELALRIVTVLSWYWFRQGPVTEGREWLRVALDGADGAPAPLRAKAHLGHAVLCYLAGDLPEARTQLERSIEANPDGDDPATRAMAQTYLGFFDAAFGDPDTAQRRIAAAHVLAQSAPPWVQPEVLMTLGQLARSRGNLPEAEQILDQARRAALEAGHGWCAASCGWIAAKTLLQAQRPAQAAPLLAQVVLELAESGDRTSLLAGLHTMAAVGAALGRSEDGAVLLGAVDAIGARIGYSPARMDPVDSEQHRALVLRRLSPAASAAAQARGRQLTLNAAVRLAGQIVNGSGAFQPA